MSQPLCLGSSVYSQSVRASLGIPSNSSPCHSKISSSDHGAKCEGLFHLTRGVPMPESVSKPGVPRVWVHRSLVTKEHRYLDESVLSDERFPVHLCLIRRLDSCQKGHCSPSSPLSGNRILTKLLQQLMAIEPQSHRLLSPVLLFLDASAPFTSL